MTQDTCTDAYHIVYVGTKKENKEKRTIIKLTIDESNL
jgi:hypothetical protein